MPTKRCVHASRPLRARKSTGFGLAAVWAWASRRSGVPAQTSQVVVKAL